MRHSSKQALHESIASNRLYLSNNTDFSVWAERVNEMSRCMIENRQRDPIVTAIVQDRSLAGNLVCTDGCIPELKGLALLEALLEALRLWGQCSGRWRRC